MQQLGSDGGQRRRATARTRTWALASSALAVLACLAIVAFAFVGVLGTGLAGNPVAPTTPGPQLAQGPDASGNVADVAGLSDEEGGEDPAVAWMEGDDAGGVAEAADIQISTSPDIVGEFESNVVLVQLAQDVPLADLNAALSQSGLVDNAQVTAEDAALGFARLQLAEGVEVPEAMNLLGNLGVVADVQPNYVYHLQADSTGAAADAAAAAVQAADTAAGMAPAALATGTSDAIAGCDGLTGQATTINDPRASSQWALDSIQAYEAWDLARAGEYVAVSNCDSTSGDGSPSSGSSAAAAAFKRVTVAILDNGCLASHEDLKNNIVATYNAVSGSSDVTPFNNHGTHVAGIVAAEANNETGVAGMSYNAGLLPIQVFSSATSASTDTIAKAYKYILSHAGEYNIRVVNMSIGITVKGSSMSDVTLGTGDKLLVSSVNDAYAKGILTTCSSGNEASKMSGAYLNYPSDWLDNALAVISLRNTTPPRRDTSSNYNMEGQTTKDIAAPGASILSTTKASASSYDTMSGTSMAAPCVAGVAALVFAANPYLNAQEASDILTSSAVDLGESGWDEVYGNGEVNALAAVKAALGTYSAAEQAVDAGGQGEAGSSGSSGSGGQTGGGDAGSGTSPEKKSLAGAAITLNKTSYVYTGVAHKPTVSVSLGGKRLTRGIDYRVGYVSNVNAGTAKVLVKGVGCYQGTLTKTFAIARANIAGTSGSAKARVASIAKQAYTGKALKPQPTVKLGSKKLVRGTDYTLSYKNNVKAGTATVVVKGKGNYTGTVSAKFKIVAPTVKYRAHVQNIGWQAAVKDGARAGTVGRGLRLEALKVNLASKPVTGSVKYRARVQGGGWLAWVKDGARAGTVGRGLPLEAVRIKLTGKMAASYDVYYRMRVQKFGWMGWAKNGARAGTAGYAYRMEAIQVKLVPKAGKAPASAADKPAFRTRS